MGRHHASGRHRADDRACEPPAPAVPAPRTSVEDEDSGWEPYDNLTVMLLHDWYDHLPVTTEPPTDAERYAYRRRLDDAAGS